jgi:hypothetical protein
MYTRERGDRAGNDAWAHHPQAHRVAGRIRRIKARCWNAAMQPGPRRDRSKTLRDRAAFLLCGLCQEAKGQLLRRGRFVYYQSLTEIS